LIGGRLQAKVYRVLFWALARRGTWLIGGRLQAKVYRVLFWALARRGISYYKSVKGAGVKAKIMTNPLIITSVSAKVLVISYFF